MSRDPGGCRATQAAPLLCVHHLERITEPGAGLALHLAEHERLPPADDEIELVASDPDVLAEDAIAAQAVVPPGSALGLCADAPRFPGGPLRVRGRQRAEPTAEPRSAGREPSAAGGARCA